MHGGFFLKEKGARFSGFPKTGIGYAIAAEFPRIQERFPGGIVNRFELLFAVRRLGVCLALTIFGCCLAAVAQIPSNPTAAQTAAQARAQAAAQARANAAQARENAAQARAAARAEKLQQKQQLATAKTTTTPSLAPPGKTAPAKTVSGTATPGTNGATSTVPRTAQTPGAQGPGGAGTVGSGTLTWATRVYTSTGCTHNGNSAVCTFTFVNQGNEANLAAGGELAGIQLVDDAHVPHRGNGAHFMDKYGTQQPRLIVAPGDSGTYVVVFPNVNPGVSSAEFHLRTQIVGGVSFAAAGAAQGTSALSTPRAKPATP